MKLKWLVLFLFAAPISSFAQKEIYQGLFIYQFSKYIKWPESYNAGNFVIGVIGNDDAFNSINSMANAKKETQGMPIVVERFSSVSQIDKPHVIFIDEGNSEKLSSVAGKVKNLPVLIVTEKPGLATQGAIINFIEQDGKMRFELNLNQAKTSGLLISNALSSLSIII